MQVLVYLASGVIAGWLAGRLMKGRDYGLTGNLILGLIGSLVGGWVMHLLGNAQPASLWQRALVALLGAMVALGIARRLKPAARETKRMLGQVGGLADLEAQMRKLGDYERRAVERLLKRGPVAKNANEVFEDQLTFGQSVADRVATFGGSWTFIGTFLFAMMLWMMWNSEASQRFDPYPFILLNLCLSCIAALQAPVIMMSQNRQVAKDRLMASNDYEVNVRAEMQLTRLHARFDELRERDWQELVEMQRRQIGLLEEVVRTLRPGQPGAAGA
jgi:uncharacterized membrane protein/uncharacterized membrane protein YeaQ/YmgE (transglycosylase-associated protein family)